MSVSTSQDKEGQGSQDRRDRKCQLVQLRTKRDRAARTGETENVS